MEKISYGNLSVPNLVVICVDETAGGDRAGRMYHCYSSRPQTFSNVFELIRKMDRFFDGIGYPQASTRARALQNGHPKKQENVCYNRRLPQKAAEPGEIIEYRGKKGTFIVGVRFRQNADWQGQVFCPEKQRIYRFESTLEFIKILSAQ